MLIAAIITIGLSGLVAQVLILRELLISFYGNELTVGILFADWLIAETLGVFISGRTVNNKNRFNLFIVFQVIFSSALPIAIYFSRTFKNIINTPYGEAVGMPAIIIGSLIALLPIGFCHGALFPICCKLFADKEAEDPAILGKVYYWEILGTIIGGITVTYLLIPFLNSFASAFLISLASLSVTIIFARKNKHIVEPLSLKAKAPSRAESTKMHSSCGLKPGDFCEGLNFIALALFFITGWFLISGGANTLHWISAKQQYKGGQLLDYSNSAYGNVAMLKKDSEYTFFYNGLPIISMPNPDVDFAEEFGHLPILFHAGPKTVLVLGGGSGGLLSEILKYPIRRVDYIELDPLLIKKLRELPCEPAVSELSDPRVNTITADARFYLRNINKNYDLILSGFPNPTDLSINRYFTSEFFALVKKRLNHNGVFAFVLEGALNYMSQDIRDLNRCVLEATKGVFEYVRPIPGYRNIILVSDSREITRVESNTIQRRLAGFGVRAKLLNATHLDYRLDKKWLVWFRDETDRSCVVANRDLRPVATFIMLKYWNKKVSPWSLRILAYFERLRLIQIVSLLSLATLLLILILGCRKNKTSIAIPYTIFTTGLYGMMANLVLIFGFQIYYANLFYMIGLVSSLFMAGAALGSFLLARVLQEIKKDVKALMLIEIIIILFCIAMMVFLAFLYLPQKITMLVFGLFFFIAGALMAAEFPLAGKIYFAHLKEASKTSAVIYSADLLGGCLGGLIGAVLLLPLLGLIQTCLVIIFLKLSSLAVLSVSAYRGR